MEKIQLKKKKELPNGVFTVLCKEFKTKKLNYVSYIFKFFDYDLSCISVQVIKYADEEKFHISINKTRNKNNININTLIKLMLDECKINPIIKERIEKINHKDLLNQDDIIEL